MGYGEKRGDYWRARYKIAPGKYGTLADANGEVARFRTKRAAEQAAEEEEAKIRGGRWRDPAATRSTFGEYANRWYAGQDLAASTMQNYRRAIEEHLLPHFNDMEIGAITKHDVETWERQERQRRYAAASIKGWRAILHLILGDAVDDGLRETNPATRRRGRGKRAGRSSNRGPEKAITDALGILLIAERLALLSGRDDEFVACVTKGYTGIRWGELVGLETQFIRPGSLRVEWQLYELDGGELHRCPPKDDSYRTIDTPEFLSGLLSRHVAAKRPEPCRCHDLRYVFSGYSAANGAPSRTGAKLVDVARKAGVSAGTVSNVLNRPEAVSEDRRLRVEAAIAELGYVRNLASGQLANHWRRSGFASWLFYPATTGCYPKRAPSDAHPVPLLAEPWPGIPARGRGAAQRAQACWVPIAPGLTPHGLRHTHRTIMEEVGTQPKLMDDRLGHEDGSVQARYSHITPRMRARLMDALTEQWEEALEARREMSPGSPVAALDALLRARERPDQRAEEESSRPRSSPNFLPRPPRNAVRGGLPDRKTAPHLQFHQSGWRDLNPRPLRPERSALPSCATPRDRVEAYPTDQWLRAGGGRGFGRASGRTPRPGQTRRSGRARGQAEQRRLGAAAEAHRREGRGPQARGHVQPGPSRGGHVAGQPADPGAVEPAVAHQRPDPRQPDLAAVGVTRQDEPDAIRGEGVEHPGFGRMRQAERELRAGLRRARNEVGPVAAQPGVVDPARVDPAAADGQDSPSVGQLDPAARRGQVLGEARPVQRDAGRLGRRGAAQVPVRTAQRGDEVVVVPGDEHTRKRVQRLQRAEQRIAGILGAEYVAGEGDQVRHQPSQIRQPGELAPLARRDVQVGQVQYAQRA